MLTWLPPRIVPMLTVGGPSRRWAWAFIADARPVSSAWTIEAIGVMALAPIDGLLLWAARPRVVSRNRYAPLWAWTMAMSVGSPTTAASGRNPEAMRWWAPKLPSSSSHVDTK
jgi:hypothetical protein